MKVLVVDDDPIARKVLDAFLKQSRCDVHMVEDSHRALCAMLAPDAPHIAIIDWMMPNMTGPELCAKLREHNFEIQPYLLMLSARKEKEDIATALDAGADDFLTKPFNITETQARLRVAQKSILRQLTFRRRIDELEKELEAQRSLHPPEAPTLPGKPKIQLDALKSEQLATVLAAALRHTGQRDTPRQISASASGARIVAWTGLLAVRDEIWIDLMLEVNPASMAALFEQAHGRKAASGELSEFNVTMQTAIQEAMRSVLRASNQEVRTPHLPLVTTGVDPFSPGIGMLVERHHYKVGAATLTLVVAAQACPLRHKAAERLRLFDVLARPYPPSETHHVPLLHSGVVLNEYYIEKLKLFTQGAADVPPVLVYTPSPVALHYNRAASPRTGRRVQA